MARLGGWLLIGLGSVLAACGLAAATVIGSDDALAADHTRLTSPGAAIVTRPGAIDLGGPTLRLDVSGDGEPVFVGVGHEVDVADLVAEVSHTSIDELDRSGVSRQSFVDLGSSDAGVIAPLEDLDWWLVQASGREATVELPLPDQPVSVLIANSDGTAGVAVDVEAELSIAGVFWISCAVALVGSGLLLCGLLILRRGRQGRLDAREAG